MATQTITVTNFVNVAGNYTRLHFASMLQYNGFTTISVELNGDNGLQWNFVGYNGSGMIVVDQYWFDSGYSLDLTNVANMDLVVQWELWVRYSGNGNITPASISSAVCTTNVENSGWYESENEIGRAHV